MNGQAMDARGFDAWEADYDQDVRACDAAGEYPFAGYARLHRQVFDLIHAREGCSVLELGCGTGTMTARITRAGHPVTAVDFSEKMLAAAGKKAPEARYLRCDLRQAPQLLAGETFDCITAVYAIHHLSREEQIALLRALRPCLKPDGAVILGDVAFPNRAGLEACREAYGEEWDDDETYLVQEELEAALPEYHVDCIPISFCADVLILSPED